MATNEPARPTSPPPTARPEPGPRDADLPPRRGPSRLEADRSQGSRSGSGDERRHFAGPFSGYENPMFSGGPAPDGLAGRLRLLSGKMMSLFSMLFGGAWS